MSYSPNTITKQSTDNTTTSTLAGGATYTGTWELVNSPDVMVSCKTDVAGTLYFDFSPDGTNADSTFPPNGFTVGAFNEFHTAVKGPRYFRVRLVNGADAQGHLRLYTYYGSFRQGNLPINADIGADADAVVVRSVNSDLDLAFGKFSGMEEDGKFGYIQNLGTSVVIGTESTWVDLWAYGTKRTSPTSSFTPYFASDDASDTDIDFTFSYLDANGVSQEVTVATDGSDGRTPVSLGVTATELTRGWNNDATGITGNVSVMTESDFTNGVPDDDAKVLAYLIPNDEQTQICMDRVPASTRRRIKKISLYCNRLSGSDTSCIAVFQTRESGKVWRTRRPLFATSSAPYSEPISGIVLEAGTDFRVRIRDISDAGTYVSAHVDFEDLAI